MRVRKRDDDTWAQYWHRRNQWVNAVLEDTNMVSFEVSLLQMRWRWTGHVARMSCHSWAWAAVSWRSLRWQRVLHFISGLRGRGHTGAGGHYLRWESLCEEYANGWGQSWWEMAQCRATWKARENAFIDSVLLGEVGGRRRTHTE